VLSKFISKSARKRLPLTNKMAGIGFYSEWRMRGPPCMALIVANLIDAVCLVSNMVLSLTKLGVLGLRISDVTYLIYFGQPPVNVYRC